MNGTNKKENKQEIKQRDLRSTDVYRLEEREEPVKEIGKELSER